MDMSMPDIFVARVRAMQGLYEPAHLALVNWGLWSRDRAGFQFGMTRDMMLAHFNSSDVEDWGDEQPVAIRTDAPAKQEKRESEPYDELAGTILDERIHDGGGLQPEYRPILRIVYVFRDIPEYQYAQRASCLPDTFLERYEAGLRFVRRFA